MEAMGSIKYSACSANIETDATYIWVENNSSLSSKQVAHSTEPHPARFLYIDLWRT